ncbi:MAG: alpha/beta fold hydrolase, partial [Ruegeria sp.]
LDPNAIADPTQTLNRWFGPDTPPERVACQQWLGDVDPMAYKAAYMVFATENGPSDNDLAGLTCRTLFMTGRAEPNSTPEMSQQMAALTPNGSARVLDGAAHMMPMTHADAVASELMTFAKGCAA